VQRIEICGSIATGKTSLARCLTHDGAFQFVEEKFHEVPFWEKFYAEPDKYAFEKNVSFLLFHSDSIRVAMKDPRPAVCDFAMFQDLSYAALDSGTADLHIISPIYERLMKRIEVPSLIIQLKCTSETQIERVRRRGRPQERAITKDYLIQLSHNIEKNLIELQLKQKVDIVEINTDEIDFVTNPRVLATISELNAHIQTLLKTMTLANRKSGFAEESAKQEDS
jgi:deoxyguanosine kinase